mgnify:CR=1 FL=1
MNIDVFEYAKQKIEDVQSGTFDRSEFPEELKGEMAKTCWNNDYFSYGMEYGYLLAMVDLLNFWDKNRGLSHTASPAYSFIPDPAASPITNPASLPDPLAVSGDGTGPG